jgi:hypothetical protein
MAKVSGGNITFTSQKPFHFSWDYESAETGRFRRCANVAQSFYMERLAKFAQRKMWPRATVFLTSFFGNAA